MTLLASMMLSADFLSARGELVIGPVEWLVGAVRALQVQVTDDAVVKKLLVVLQALGQVAFYPPSVDYLRADPRFDPTRVAVLGS